MLHHIIFLNMKNRLYMQLQNITTTLSPSCQVLTKIHASIFSVVHHTKWNYGFSVERKIKQNIMTPYPVVGRWLLDHLIGQIPSKGELSPMSKNYTTEPPPPQNSFCNHNLWNLWQTSFYCEEHYSGKNDKHKSMKVNWRCKYWCEWLRNDLAFYDSSVLVTTLWHGSIYT